MAQYSPFGHPMKKYTLHREQFLPISIHEAWAFFSQAKNLERITPKDMGFVVLTELDDEPIFNGLKIDYIVRPLLGIPVRWTTEITSVSAPMRFTDRQLKGPYALWEHTHTFQEVPGGVNMIDDVVYSLPFGWLGNITHTFIVKNKLDQIFDFRKKTLSHFFETFD